MDENTKNVNSFPFGSKENYFLSQIYSKGKFITGNVKSKLVLNEINYKIKPFLLLYPSIEDHLKISRHFELEIKGFFENVAQEKVGEIHIPRAYMERSLTSSFSSSWEENVIEVFPDEIYLKHYLKGEEVRKGKAYITFFLTDNKIVRPWGSITRSYRGQVKSELEPRVIIKLDEGWIIKFEDHFYYLDTTINKVHGNFSSSQLVLTFEKDNYLISSISEVWKMTNLVNNLLWYLSFGTRQSTTWIKWEAVVGNEYVEYYRNVSMPEENDYYEPLVDRGSIQEFLQHCLAYQEKKNNLNLHLPIVYLVGSAKRGKTAESEFLSLFMSLEALLNLFARSRHKNAYFSGENQEKWSNLFGKLRETIDEMGDLNGNDRAFFVGKLGNLNQTSIKVKYQYFCKEMTVDNSDLWPIDEDQDRDLYRIRNKLIHGKQFGYESFFGIAKEHLRWIIERCLLRAVRWEKKTDVDREVLYNYTAYLDWKSYYTAKPLSNKTLLDI